MRLCFVPTGSQTPCCYQVKPLDQFWRDTKSRRWPVWLPVWHCFSAHPLPMVPLLWQKSWCKACGTRYFRQMRATPAGKRQRAKEYRARRADPVKKARMQRVNLAYYHTNRAARNAYQRTYRARRRLALLQAIPCEQRTRRQQRTVMELLNPTKRWCWWHQTLHSTRAFGKNRRSKGGLALSCRTAYRERDHLQRANTHPGKGSLENGVTRVISA